MATRISEGAGKTYRCPCCGFKTLLGRGQDEICSVCFWQDDGQDESDSKEVWGGPNGTLSLHKAQENFKLIGAAEERLRRFVRGPLSDEF
jgi:hypothetical protein